MAFVNLTPHAIVVVRNEGNITIQPSGQIARCAQKSESAGSFDGVPLVTSEFGPVEGLPEPVMGTVYVVSALVRAAVPNRRDVASPGDQVRDADGRVTGCRNLIINNG